MINIRVAKAIKTYEDYAIYVSFGYNQTIVDTIRAFPTRYWNKDEKEWELPFSTLKQLLAELSEFEIEIDGPAVIEKPKIKIDFDFKTTPYEHQILGFNFGLEHDRWLLGDEMGLGKTKQVIDIAVAKKQALHYKHCLIICGVNGLKYNWYNEVYTHSNENAWILGQTVKNGHIKVGSNADKLSDLLNIDKLNAYFIITNVETLRNDDIAHELAMLCEEGTINMIAFDECHKCFDYNTLITTDMGDISIGDIVTKHMNVNALSKNLISGELEYKPITGWFENTICEPLMELEIETSSGVKTVRCTSSHKFYTSNRGWVCAKDLTDDDDLVDNVSFM